MSVSPHSQLYWMSTYESCYNIAGCSWRTYCLWVSHHWLRCWRGAQVGAEPTHEPRMIQYSDAMSVNMARWVNCITLSPITHTHSFYALFWDYSVVFVDSCILFIHIILQLSVKLPWMIWVKSSGTKWRENTPKCENLCIILGMYWSSPVTFVDYNVLVWEMSLRPLQLRTIQEICPESAFHSNLTNCCLAISLCIRCQIILTATHWFLKHAGD